MPSKRLGRPPTGNTDLVWGRVPASTTRTIEERAEEFDLPKARVVGALLAYALAHEDEVAYPLSTARRKQQEQQEALPLTEAS